jgi:lipid-A-disaccharide synthase
VTYVGNPLVEIITNFASPEDFHISLDSGSKPVIAILPGSRRQEIKSMLSIMLELVSEFPEYKFVVAAVDNIPEDYYRCAIENPQVKVVTNQAYELLSVATAAVVTSGTASLETALFEVPQVVCYKTSWLTYWVGRVLIKVPYLSLVNLIAGNQVVPELIQTEYNKERVMNHLEPLLTQGSIRKNQLAGYRKVRILLGNKKASKETAKLILDYLSSRQLPVD